jgi:Family of unknown function (DUF6510)
MRRERSNQQLKMEALDGNAIVGTLYHVFGAEMTMAPAECGGCGARGRWPSARRISAARASSFVAASANTS